VVNRVIGKEVGGKQNILIFNDEAHHAYRIRQPENGDEEDDEDESEDFYKEATVWIDGLDRVHKQRGINFSVDLSATPYFLGRVGQETNRTFPWVVSDFGLTDAIESGLTKIPQLVVRDTAGQPVPSYFNIWRWLLKQMTNAERGGRRANPKPEAVLKYAYVPIVMLAELWDDLREEWERDRSTDLRPPVFITVCKNVRIADVIYRWLGENDPPVGIPPSKIKALTNTDEQKYTIRVDSKVVAETDTGEAKSDENRWMRLTLDMVGKREWPKDRQGRPIYPEGFEDLAKKLDRPLYPPGRDVRCIVSVGMLTEGWDCNTVTHIVGLRPFMSQLLCEQVVGRGLRRSSYEVGDDGKLTEEVAKVFGVPFEIIPFKQSKGGSKPSTKRHHIHALHEKAAFEIKYPRVDGYRQAIRNRVTIDWNAAPTLTIDPMKIPPEVEVKSQRPEQQRKTVALRSRQARENRSESVPSRPKVPGASIRYGGGADTRVRQSSRVRSTRARPLSTGPPDRRSISP
jgi:type III restriction enzyme